MNVIKGDGSIVINTEIDNAEAQKQLNRLKKKIRELEKELNYMESERLPLAEQAKEAAAKLDEANAKLHEMQTATKGAFSAEQIAEQKETVRALQVQYDTVQKKVEGYDRKIENATKSLNKNKEEAGEVAEQLTHTSAAAGKMSKAMEKANARLSKFSRRITELFKSALIFSVITKALTGLRDWMGDVIKTNDEARAAVARLKGALLTLAQPLVEYIIPAFTAFVNILASLAAKAAELVSMLFGSTAKESAEAAENLYAEANAMEETGKAAKEAAKYLAPFDELNVISDNSESEGIEPTFDFDTSEIDISMEKLLRWVELIGVGLLAWKLSDSFKGGLQAAAGLLIAIEGAIKLIKGAWDAWQNGINMDNFMDMLSGVLLLAAGLGLAFGTVGAAIGLVVGGLTLLVTGIHDAMESGWNFENTLASIAGLLFAGIGIAALTGSWIPLLIAAIASVLLALTVATGHGEELLAGIRLVCEGFVDFITGIFTGDIDKAIGGISKIFDGLGLAISAVINGLRDTFLSFLDWLDEKTNGKLHGIIETVKGFFTAFFDVFLKPMFQDNIAALKQVLTGLIEFITGVFTGDWDKAWEGVKEIFKGIFNNVIGILEASVNLIISGLNWLIKQMNKIHFDVPEWVPGVGGKSVGINISEIGLLSIPRLATGAVIPPNREFMAVLGDQSSGNNIEAPESLIRQIVREESGSSGEVLSVLQAILEATREGHVLEADGRTLARVMYKYNQQTAAEHGSSFVKRGVTT